MHAIASSRPGGARSRRRCRPKSRSPRRHEFRHPPHGPQATGFRIGRCRQPARTGRISSNNIGDRARMERARHSIAFCPRSKIMRTRAICPRTMQLAPFAAPAFRRDLARDGLVSLHGAGTCQGRALSARGRVAGFRRQCHRPVSGLRTAQRPRGLCGALAHRQISRRGL